MRERLTFNHGAATLVRELYGGPTASPRTARVSTPHVSGSAAVVARAAVEPADLAYWAAFAFTGLLFFRPQDTVPLLAPLHLSEVAAIVGLLAMIAGRVNRGLPLMPVTPEVLGVWAIAVVMLSTMPFSVWPGGAFGVLKDVYLKVALVFVLLLHSLKSPKQLRQFAWLIVLAMGYVAVRGVTDYARGMNLLEGGRLYGPIAGLMGNPNDLAMNMVTFLPLAGFFALSRGHALQRLLAAGIALAMIATILFTKSRAGMLGLAAMGIVFVLHARAIRPGVGILALVGMLATAPLMPASFWTRVSSIVNQEQDETGSREARKRLMTEAWQIFLERPLTGVGAGQFQNYNPPDRIERWRETHNVILQVLVELGIFGGVAFVFLLVRSGAAVLWTLRWFPPLRRRMRARVASRWAQTEVAFDPQEREWMRLHMAAVSAGFVGWFVCAQFASIGYYWTFYYLLALIVAARQITRERLKKVSLAPPVEFRL